MSNPPARLTRYLLLAAVLGLTTLDPTPSRSQVKYTPDITVDLADTVVADENVANDNLAGAVTLEALGALPASAEVDAYARAGHDHLFSLDTTVLLQGDLTVIPADVVRYDGATYKLEFDAIAEGLPDAANVDALSTMGSDLVLSFDTTVDLGGGVVAADEDLVSFDGTSFALVFDGSVAGLDPAVDLDAVSVTAGGGFNVSFDTGGTVGGQNFDDDTVLAYSGSSWSIAFDGSDEHSNFAAADLIALPEPSWLLGLISGSAVLFALARRRPFVDPLK